MHCKRAEQLVDGYLMHELSADQLEDFERHLDGCTSCREEIEQMRASLDGAAAFLSPPRGLTNRTMDRLRACAAGRDVVATPERPRGLRPALIIAPNKKLQLSMTYPMSVGRNFAEVLRALDALQATYGTPIATPANWTMGQDVIVALSLDDAAAKERFGEFDAVLPYLRKAKSPV